MPNFQVTLALFFPEGRGGRVFHKKVKLPFAPTNGLELQLAEDDEGMLTFTVEQLSYDMGDGTFTAVNGISHEEDIQLYLDAGFVEQLQPGQPRKARRKK